MGDSEILFDHVPDFGDGLVSIDFVLCQFRPPGGLGHDAVGDLVQIQKIPIVFSKIPFVRIHSPDGLIGMTTAGNAERKIRAVMVGSGGHFRSENKPIMGIDGGMFLKPEMRLVIFDCPVRFEIAGKLKDVAILVQFSLGCFALFLFFLQFLLTEGMAGRFNQTGIDGYAFVDG